MVLSPPDRHLFLSSPLSRAALVNRHLKNTPILTPLKVQPEKTLMQSYISRLTRTSSPLFKEPEIIIPTRILDAPGIEDDYYLNLMDWSSTNLLAVGLSTTVYVWNAATGTTQHLLSLSETITALSWSPTGNTLAIGTKSGRLELLSITKGERITLRGHGARVGVLAWHGEILTSGSRDRSIQYHDPRQKTRLGVVCGAHEQEVCGMKWDHWGRLASGGNDNNVNIWDMKKYETPMIKWEEHTAAVKALAWSPTIPGVLASGGGTADRTIKLWNIRQSTSVSTTGSASQVCNLAWSPTGTQLCTTHGFSEHLCLRWEYPEMRISGIMRGHGQRVLYLAPSPDGQTVATGSADETIRLWSIFRPPPPTLLNPVDFR